MFDVTIVALMFPASGPHVDVIIKNPEGWKFTIKAEGLDSFVALGSLIPEFVEVMTEAQANYADANRPSNPETIEPDLLSGSATRTVQLEKIDALMALRGHSGFKFP